MKPLTEGVQLQTMQVASIPDVSESRKELSQEAASSLQQQIEIQNRHCYIAQKAQFTRRMSWECFVSKMNGLPSSRH